MPAIPTPVSRTLRSSSMLAFAVATGWLTLVSGMVQAQSFGLVSDAGSNLVHVFDADLDLITTQIPAGPGYAVGDCAIATNTRVAYATSSGNEVSFIQLADGQNLPVPSGIQVPISNLGLDLALSPDDSFLVLSGGGSLQQPLSVVDTQLAREVSTTGLFADHTSIEFCDNGTLLITTTSGKYYAQGTDNALYDAGIDDSGAISLRGSRLSSGQQPNNAACAPGSLSGVLLDRSGVVTSFTLPGLQEVEKFDTGDGASVSAVFSADGKQLFVRSVNYIQSFDFNPVTGAMQLVWKQPAPRSSRFYGVEQIALHPDGTKLYVDGGKAVLILDSRTGLDAGLIAMGETAGICFANRGAPAPGVSFAQTGPAPAWAAVSFEK